jgi:hypothetical protein
VVEGNAAAQEPVIDWYDIEGRVEDIQVLAYRFADVELVVAAEL